MIIFIGLSTIAYPKISELYADYQQQKLIKEWQENLAIIDNEDTIEIENKKIQNLCQECNISTKINENKLNAEEQKKREEEKKKEEEKAAREKENYIQKYMEGVLKIDKIKFSQPILKGATKENMKISVASIENTGKAGEIGNYAIAGHRSRTFGRNFNRLEEVEAGDTVKVDSGDNQYKYTVTEKLYVKPEEVWVLYSNGKDKEITLITCHPMNNPTQRLIIKGKIID